MTVDNCTGIHRLRGYKPASLRK